MRFKTLRTPEFDDWLAKQSMKSQVQIEKRISNIELDGHFGTTNDVGDEILELKWRSGRRVYYAHLVEQNILLLLGGNKNGQNQDIKQAKKIFREYTEDA